MAINENYKRIINYLLIQNQYLEKLSTIDSLTEVFNRRYFYKKIGNLSYSQLNNTGFIFLDIDNFKNINDTFGHPYGDEILKLLCKNLKNNIRVNDDIYRLGGDEFLVALYRVDFNSIFKIAEKLKNIISSLSLKDGTSLTVSMGYGEFKNSQNIEEFIKKLDTALYLAKKNGKNKIFQCN